MTARQSLNATLSLRISDELFQAIDEAAKERGIDRNSYIRERLGIAVIDDGQFLSEECPENPARGWPKGSANHAVARRIKDVLPHLRQLLGPQAYIDGVERFERLWEAIMTCQDPKKLSYALDKFSDHTLTPLQRVRHLEDRFGLH
jgi:predicted DNA-binding protein